VRTRRSVPLALLLGLACALAASQVEKAGLEFAPAAGTRLLYSVSGQVAVDGKNFMGKDLTLNGTAMGDIRFDVLTSARDTVRAALTSPGVNVQVVTPDRTLSQILKTQEGKALEVVFNRTGKIAGIRNPEVLSPSSLMNFSIPQILGDYFPTFPVNPVGPGDEWKEERRLTIPFQGIELQVNLAIRYTLNDVFPSPEGRLAVVGVTYTVTVSGAKDLGETMGVFEGSGAGTGFLNLNVDRGYFTDYRVDFKTDAAFVMKQGTKRLFDWPFTFSVLAEVNLLEARTD
jgi:hypothetical protein